MSSIANASLAGDLPYEIHSTFGSGPIGRVFAVQEHASDIPLALKLIHSGLCEDSVRRKVLLDTCQRIISSPLPHITAVAHVSARENRQFVVTQRDTGESLASAWTGLDEQRRRCNPDVARGYISQVASALHELHMRDVCSGNLKPSNVRIHRDRRDGGQAAEFLVSDVVFADLIAANRLLNRHADVAVFAAPEQFDGLVDARSDQYALAVLSWIWLRGYAPFAPRSVPAIIQQKRAVDSIIVRHQSKLDARILSVLKRALQPDPSARFPSISVFHDELAQAIDHERSGLALDGTAVAPPKISRRQFFWGALVAVESAVLLAIAQPKLERLMDSFTAAQTTAQSPVPPSLTISHLNDLVGPHDQLNAVNWSPSSSVLASASDDKMLYIWDTTAHQQQGSPLIGHDGRVTSVAWDPAGYRLASSSYDTTVRIWDASSLTTTKVLRGHSEIVYGVAWYADGSKLISGSVDKSLRIWDAATGQPLQVIRPTNLTTGIRVIALSPNGAIIATGDLNGDVRLFDAKTGAELGMLAGTETGKSVLALAFSPDGSVLASSGLDARIHLWNPTLRTKLETLPAQPAFIRSLAWSHDQKFIGAGYDDGNVIVWRSKGPVAVWGAFQGYGSARSLEWNATDDLLAVGTSHKMVQLWQVR